MFGKKKIEEKTESEESAVSRLKTRYTAALRSRARQPRRLTPRGDGGHRSSGVGLLLRRGAAWRAYQIIDVIVAAAQRQKLSDAEKTMIRSGSPSRWFKAKQRQEDIDARWTIKRD